MIDGREVRGLAGRRARAAVQEWRASNPNPAAQVATR